MTAQGHTGILHASSKPWLINRWKPRLTICDTSSHRQVGTLEGSTQEGDQESPKGVKLSHALNSSTVCLHRHCEDVIKNRAPCAMVAPDPYSAPQLSVVVP
jgi:hypothetical protein